MKTPKFDPYEAADSGEIYVDLRLMQEGDREAIERCVSFMEADTRGTRHNRFRARISRRLKHCRLSAAQQARLVDAVLARFGKGRIDEQFKDQLRLALRLQPGRVFAAAEQKREDARDYVRRYSAWILAHE